MREITGNIWDFYAQGKWIVITTNGNTKSNGEAIMGRGVALEAAQRLPELPQMLGQRLRAGGNHFADESLEELRRQIREL